MTEKTIKLKMKKRGTPRVVIGVGQAQEIVASGDKDTAWSIFKAMSDNPSQEHDKDFMILIVNWTPQDGQSMMEVARWARLALKIDRLNVDKEETLVLTEQEADMIIDRLRKPDFKIRSTSTGFYHFIVELEDTIGQKINVSKEEEKDG